MKCKNYFKACILGDLPAEKAANLAFGVIEELESLKLVDGNIPPELAQKLKRLDPDLQEQFVRVGLVRRVEQPKTLEQLFDAYYE
ncbi:MAG: hypothetical protein GY904_34855, partial [Planctomycetaceae bacterium]|nr:hypothetical protein [Planctomycetaceae bacterium]